MKKTDLGTKRKCPECDTKFYDLNRNPIKCPNCNHEFVLEKPVAVEKKVEKNEKDNVEQEELKSEDGPEIISLEETEPEQIVEKIPSIDDDESSMDSSEDSNYNEDDEDVAEIVTESDDEDDS